MKRGRYIILQEVTCNNWLVIYHQHKRYTIFNFSENYTIYDKVNPPINVRFLLSALYNKRLILSLKSYKPPSNKCHLTEGVTFIKNIPVTVTFGVKYMKINTCTKISLSKTRKSMPPKLVPLKCFILYRCSIAFIIPNF